MGVVYIGDRATGKTALAMELINPQFDYVHIPNQSYQGLRDMRFDEETQSFRPTGEVMMGEVWNETRYLEVEVDLPAGNRTILVDWIDTPGEIWRKSWQSANPSRWQEVVRTVQNSEGIMLILPPYREISGMKPDFADQFPTQQQWCNRFERWVDFLLYDCRQVRHIVICLNKADLFSHVDREAAQLAYNPLRSSMNWFQRNAYVTQRYFRPVQRQIERISKQTSGLPPRCFITSIYNRSLLELPWIYLASHLAS